MSNGYHPNPNNLGYKVTSRNVSWRDQVVRAWGDQWAQPDHNVYQFSNGRTFDSTDQGTTGIYEKL